MKMSPPDRSSFQVPENVSYLNCAYLSPLLNESLEKGREYVSWKAQPWTIFHRDFFEQVERLRSSFAKLIHATSDDIAIVPSTAYGIAIASANVTLAAGDNVVVPAFEHSSSYHKWRVATAAADAELREVAVDDGANWTAAITNRIDDRTSVVSVPNVHWSDGRLFDLVAVGRAAKKVGAAFIVDGTQSIGALPFDVRQIGADFVTCSAYKWLLCPYGLAFLYVAPGQQDGQPLEEHGFHRSGADRHEGRLDQLVEFDQGARRFDTAERSNFITVPMSIVALDQLREWTVPGIQSRIVPISQAIISGAAELGYMTHAPDQRAPHLFGLRRASGLPADLANKLTLSNVFVSIRGDAIRVSPHVYNSTADVEHFLEVLRAAG